MIEWIVYLCAFGAWYMVLWSVVVERTAAAELRFHNALARLDRRREAVNVVAVVLDWDGRAWRGVIPGEDTDCWSVLVVPRCNEPERGDGRAGGNEWTQKPN